MNTQEMINASQSLVEWINMHVDGLRMSSERRYRLAVACFDMVHEHHRAIVLLCKCRIYGTAFAILRLPFEAFVRGMWLYRCATPEDIKKFCADSRDIRFGELVKKVEALPAFNSGALSIIKGQTWNAMNSYTHTGYRQVVRRNTSESITPCYEEGAIHEVLDLCNTFAVVATLAIAEMAEHPWLGQAMLEKQKEMKAALSRYCNRPVTPASAVNVQRTRKRQVERRRAGAPGG